MKHSFRSKYIVLIVSLVLAFTLATPVAAQGLVYGSSIPAGATVEQDVLLVGQNVTIDGDVEGNVFVLGNQVTVNGRVDGSLVLIGQNAGITGTVSGSTYAAALTLDLGPQAALQRDLYVATVSLTSGKESLIGRDLFAVGLDSGLSGHVGRTLHTAIGPIQLYNGAVHLLGFDELAIKLHFEVPPADGGSGSGLAPAARRALLRHSEKAAGFDWAGWGLDLLRNWGVLFLLGLLALWLLRGRLERSAAVLQARPVRTTAVGLLVLVIAFALAGVALLLAVLVFAIGLGLNSLGLWQLSLGFWALAYSGLAMFLAVLWFLIVYGTKIIVIFLAAGWLFGRIFHRKAVWLDVLALLAGALVYGLLLAIPYVGWVFGVLVTAAGAGAAWLETRANRQAPAPLPPVPVKPAPRRVAAPVKAAVKGR